MENNIDLQTIYINMDDSGQLTKSKPDELVFVYGGIFFLSLHEQERFSRQYSSIVNEIKHKYCSNFNANLKNCTIRSICESKYPELKSSMLKSNDKRRLLNFIKKFNTSVAVVSNYDLKDSIFENKASRGRYKDYVIKREIKKIVEDLISENKIDPTRPVKLILNLDEQTTVSNGYYDLSSSIKEELQFGILNYNYGIMFKPILKSVSIELNYKDSYCSYPVQAADLIVGEVRHAYYNRLKSNDFITYKKRTNFLNTSIYLP